MLKRLSKRSLTVITTSALVLILVLFFSAKQISSERREKVLLETIMRSLNFMHYDPVVFDGTHSETVFEQFLQALDVNKKFFLQSDISSFSVHKDQIDDQISRMEFGFFNAVEKVIEQRIIDASQYYSEILASPFNYTIEEEIELNPEKNEWCESPEQLKDEWRKALKYQVLLRIHQDLEIQETALEKEDTIIKQRTYYEIEQAAREQVKRTHDDYFDRLMKLTRDDRFSMYLNTISTIYDPHTNYFPPKLRDDFDIAMSGKLEGIGAVLTQRGGFIHVEEIMPGSPSWKQGELKSGDIILKVAQGDAEPVDVTSMRLDDAVKLIRGKKGTEARLTVRKKLTDEIMIIRIIRDVVEMEQTYARSAILNTSDGKRIGYIYLPKFYVDFSNPINGRNCSEDIRKELIKLNNEGVDALVFDLRNNGGGSLQDVVKMSGYFIPRGPVVQVKDKLEGLDIMSDNDPSVLYNGPMVVMVNAGSASASEIMAAALQDYRRAIIVGSTATFGKGTVQRMIDLDMLIQTTEAGVKPLGSMKLTTQKFYRINGGATQLKGVTADIILPDRYSYIDFGEKDLDNAMEWSSIPGLSFEPWTGVYGNPGELSKNSSKRVEENEIFSAMDEFAMRLKKQREETKETLNLDKFRQKQAQRKKENERINKLLEQENSLKIDLLSQDATSLKEDSVKLRIMNDWIRGLNRDIYLEETTQIVEDMLTKETKGRARRR